MLYVAPSWFTVRYRLRGQLAWLRERGFEIGVCSESDSRAEEAATAEGAAFHGVPELCSSNPLALVRAMTAIRSIIRDGRYDLVNYSTKKGGLITTAALRRLPGVAGVYFVHGLTSAPDTLPRRVAGAWVERHICARADRVVFISDSNRRLRAEQGVCPSVKSVVLGAGSCNGIDTERFARSPELDRAGAPLRERCGFGPECFVFGFVGRLVVEKGVRGVADASRPISRHHPHARLMLVSPPEVDARLRKYQQAFAENPTVARLGFLSDPRPAYAALNCLLLPSYSEGFGDVLLEAASMSLPAIAARVVGCVDAVDSGTTGLLVTARSWSALAAAMNMVADHPAWARAMGAQGRSRCVREFQPHALWDSLASLYSLLLQRAERTT